MNNQKLALNKVAAYLASRCQAGPAGKELAYRTLLYDWLADLPVTQAPLAYAMLSGLEERNPNLWKLLSPQKAHTLDAINPPAIVASRAGVARVEITGEIAYRSFQAELEAIKHADTVYLVVNSCGGDATTALALCAALKGKTTTAVVTHNAFSAALLIVQACQKRQALAGSLLMAHAPFLFAAGNATDLYKAAGGLETCTRDAVALFNRCKPEYNAQGWLQDGEDHFFTPAQALAAGLIDEILPQTIKDALAYSAPATPELARGQDEDAIALLFELFDRVKSCFKNPETFIQVLESICRHGQPLPGGGEPCGG